VLAVLAAITAVLAVDQPVPPDTFASDLFFNGLSLLLIALPVWDWRAAWLLCRAAYKRPRIEALTASAVTSLATATAATLAAFLGLNRIEAVVTGNAAGFIPTWLALLLLAAALVVISLPNIYKVRLFRRWENDSRALKYHQRDQERLLHPHRRWDDPPLEGEPDVDPQRLTGRRSTDLRDPRTGPGTGVD
jgi:hypothetical protein